MAFLQMEHGFGVTYKFMKQKHKQNWFMRTGTGRKAKRNSDAKRKK